MRAIILAGGKGTRLRPYTSLIPKPLVPLGGKYSILEIIIMQLRNHGFTDITLAVNHLAHLIMSYFGDGSRLGVNIDYSLEEGELSTIGPLTLIKNLPDNFLVMNGDILCDLNYAKFFANHLESNADISVSVFKRTVNIDFGVLYYDLNKKLERFQEKPSFDFSVSMGIYCISKKIVNNLTKGERYGFDNLMIDSIKDNRSVNIELFQGYWLDIGRPEDYEFADSNFENLTKKLNIL
jgi:NDP-sugar pyrophosphorylase family protein